MQLELLTLPENLECLRNEIYKFTNDKAFLQSKTMGDIMKASFEYVRKHYEEVDTHSQF
jgi:hypothetical protein